ncbi:Hachiman antiphage defense system protein HamA, partial [Lysobacter sp. 2RAB21]
VYGVDGLHAKFEDGIMTLYFLESKLSETAAKGIGEYCESTADFSANRKQYLLENSIINDLGNFDTLSPSERALALSYLDIYGDNKSQRVERSVGIICYSESAFNKKLPKNGAPPKDHEDGFSKKYESKRPSYQNALNDGAIKRGLSP